MKVLIVEDNDIKLDKIAGYLSDNYQRILLNKKKSYSSALNAIKSDSFDLVILDMSIPSYDKEGLENGGRTRTFGGKEIASQMRRKNIITPFLVITQFDGFTFGDKFIKISDLESQLKEEYKNQFLGIIHFDAISSSWREELGSIVSNIMDE